MKQHQVEFVTAAYVFNANNNIISRRKITELLESQPHLTRPRWLTGNPKYRHTARGYYVMPMEGVKVSNGGRPPVVKNVPAPVPVAVVNVPQVENTPAVKSVSTAPATDVSMDFNGGQSLVPDRLDVYVSWGNHEFVRKIVDSGAFFPVYISGLSGNGKTTTIEQVCAETGREFFRVNITTETDEDDLLGGFRLIDGNTVFQYGPVVEAMRRGGILMLDEVDQGSTKIMCLQSVLEGRGVYLKKINRWIHPAAGFNVFLTGNTKGQGNGEHDDKFVGAQVMNEAFLDRIPVMIEQDYPPVAVEKKILVKVVTKFCGSANDDSKGFIDNLAKWAEIVRRTFNEGAIEDVITTRRLVQIVQAYCILGDRLDSIRNCISRFDRSVQESFLNLYTKIDGEVEASPGDSGIPDGTAVSAAVDLNWALVFDVPFADRFGIKAAGARWNADARRWWMTQEEWYALAKDGVRDNLFRMFAPSYGEIDYRPEGPTIKTIVRKMTETEALAEVTIA